MTLKIKLLMTGLVCLGLGSFWVNYQSFRNQENLKQFAQNTKDQQSVEWVAELAEQRLTQLEDAVSYLDKSTVETLKRMGARYFVYAYQNGDDWKLKWKVIGEMGESQILSEVNEIDFAKLDEGRRSWFQSRNQQLIYLAPVAVAKSHQLKEGFLVFGLNPDFFSFLARRDPQVFIATQAALPIYANLPQALLEQEERFDQLVATPEIKSQIFSEANLSLTAYFSAKMQAWVMRSTELVAGSFVRSSSFTLFLASYLFSGGLFILLLFAIRWPTFEVSSLRPSLAVNWPVLWRQKTKSEVQDELGRMAHPLAEQEDEHLTDIAEFLDQTLESEHVRLNKLGVSLTTQVEEGVEVLLSPHHMEDFLRRLIGNSALVLEDEEEKRIQIQVVEQSQSYQLIYLDTRSKNFPSAEPSSLLLQTEGSLTGIDGILAYGSWYFSDKMHVAKSGFCLSIDLNKPSRRDIQTTPQAMSPVAHSQEPAPFEEDVVTPLQFKAVVIDTSSSELTDQTTARENEDSIADDFDFESFELKDFDFEELNEEIDRNKISDAVIEDLKVDHGIASDEKGLFEFNGGDFKIKIRSPRKRDKDVNC